MVAEAEYILKVSNGGLFVDGLVRGSKHFLVKGSRSN